MNLTGRNKIRNRLREIVFAVLVLFCFSVGAQDRVEEQVAGIDAVFFEINISNGFEINNSGGHLQGIQKMDFEGGDYLFMTGSSSEYSYLTVVNGDEKCVVSVKKILDKPFKHAGGCQIYEDLMAIGVEDNNLKNRSKVFVWKVDEPGKIGKPLKVIERTGKYKRATAGCTAIVKVKGFVLIVVGDWDTAHLDFYRIREADLYIADAGFEKVFSMTANELDRSDWVNGSWPAYQNINFLKDSSGNLYLAGLGVEDGINVLDLFAVGTDDFSRFTLKKISTRSFGENDKVNFNYGAGIYQDKEEIEVLACPSHIEKETTIYISKINKNEETDSLHPAIVVVFMQY